MNNNQPNISNKNVAYNGAIVAIAAVFAYSIIIMVYILIRSSSTIYSIMPNGERSSILWASGVSVAYSIVIFSLFMGALSSVLGVMAAAFLKKLLLCFNRQFQYNKAISISFITALMLITIIYFLLFTLLKDWMTIKYIETFLFWFLFPAAIFLIVCIIGGSQLNKILKAQL